MKREIGMRHVPHLKYDDFRKARERWINRLLADPRTAKHPAARSAATSIALLCGHDGASATIGAEGMAGRIGYEERQAKRAIATLKDWKPFFQVISGAGKRRPGSTRNPPNTYKMIFAPSDFEFMTESTVSSRTEGTVSQESLKSDKTSEAASRAYASAPAARGTASSDASSENYPPGFLELWHLAGRHGQTGNHLGIDRTAKAWRSAIHDHKQTPAELVRKYGDHLAYWEQYRRDNPRDKNRTARFLALWLEEGFYLEAKAEAKPKPRPAESTPAQRERSEVSAEDIETGAQLNTYINDNIRAGKLTGVQAKVIHTTFKVERLGELEGENLARATTMINDMIAKNVPQVKLPPEGVKVLHNLGFEPEDLIDAALAAQTRDRFVVDEAYLRRMAAISAWSEIESANDVARTTAGHGRNNIKPENRQRLHQMTWAEIAELVAENRQKAREREEDLAAFG